MYHTVHYTRYFVSIADEAEYRKVLDRWAYETHSDPEWAYRGPGKYEKIGYFSDEGVATATLRKGG